MRTFVKPAFTIEHDRHCRNQTCRYVALSSSDCRSSRKSQRVEISECANCWRFRSKR